MADAPDARQVPARDMGRIVPPRGGRLFGRRLVQLYLGLCLYGVSLSLQVRAALGLDPWDVFHQGVSGHTGLRFGTVVIVVGVAVLLLWIPMRQRPGIGTVSNAVVVGLVVNVLLDLLPPVHSLPVRWVLLAGGITLNGVATGCYIGAGLGPGPRDGLMTGLAARGWSIRLVRTGIEVSVLAIGFLLGGSVGVGTVLYAASIGPLAHLFIPMLTIRPRHPEGRSVSSAASTAPPEPVPDPTPTATPVPTPVPTPAAEI